MNNDQLADGSAALLIAAVMWFVVGLYTQSDLILYGSGIALTLAMIGLGVFTE